MLSRSDVKSVSFSFDAPSSDNSWNSNFAFDKMIDKDYSIRLKFGDQDYLKTYGLQLAAGKFYGESDTARGYVVNETLVKSWAKTDQEAIGKDDGLVVASPKPVVAVIKDFKLQSLREEVPPLVLLPQ